MKNKTAKRSVIEQEVPDRAPKGWADVQESIAESSGLALLLVDGYQPPALVVANNNSICNALQSSPDYIGLCDPYSPGCRRQTNTLSTSTPSSRALASASSALALWSISSPLRK